MKRVTNNIKKSVTLLLLASVVGCSSIPGMDKVLPDRKVEYKNSRQVENELEVPPDLTRDSINDEMVIPGVANAPSNTSLAQIQQRGGGSGAAQSAANRSVLPAVNGIRMVRDGDRRWLLIDEAPEEVWYRVEEFWQQNGIVLEQQDPSIGVMVTGWLENLADIKSDFVTDAFRSFAGGLYSASTRDQFRVRIEEGSQPGTTELYLTHRGMQETIVQDSSGQLDHTVWNPRPTDEFLETEMLRRLMVSLGVAEQQASSLLAADSQGRQPLSRLNKNDGGVSLLVDADLDRTWRLTGVALDRVGFAVEDRNRSGGIYYVRYNDPMKGVTDEGFLSKLAFWRDRDANIDKENQYQVTLNEEGDKTRILVLSPQGERDDSETAQRILTLLNEQLR